MMSPRSGLRLTGWSQKLVPPREASELVIARRVKRRKRLVGRYSSIGAKAITDAAWPAQARYELCKGTGAPMDVLAPVQKQKQRAARHRHVDELQEIISGACGRQFAEAGQLVHIAEQAREEKGLADEPQNEAECAGADEQRQVRTRATRQNRARIGTSRVRYQIIAAPSR
jgi:hypothetical protein